MQPSLRITGYQMEVVLLDVHTPVQRTVEVPSRLRLAALHDVLQIAMGWQDEHLWQLQWGPIYITDDPDSEIYANVSPDLVLDAAQVKLASLALSQDSLLTYTYDFGDNWVHLVRVTEILGTPIPRPRVLDGVGACPPEDVGGVDGYQEFLEAWSDPDHEEHDETVTWASGWYMPGPFDPSLADARMAKRFRVRSAVKAGPRPGGGGDG